MSEDPRLTADLAAPITGECPTCHGNVTLEYVQHEHWSIVGTETWTETRYLAAFPAVGEEGLDMERLAKVLRHHVTMIAGTSTEELAEAIAAEYAALATAEPPNPPTADLSHVRSVHVPLEPE